MSEALVPYPTPGHIKLNEVVYNDINEWAQAYLDNIAPGDVIDITGQSVDRRSYEVKRFKEFAEDNLVRAKQEQETAKPSSVYANLRLKGAVSLKNQADALTSAFAARPKSGAGSRRRNKKSNYKKRSNTYRRNHRRKYK